MPTSPSDTNIFETPLGGQMFSLAANALAGEPVDALTARLTQAAANRHLLPVQASVFCDPSLGIARHGRGIAGGGGSPAADLPAADSAGAFPVTFLGHHETPRGCVTSARLVAVPRSIGSLPVFDGRGAICGRAWETDSARYLLLGALTPPDASASREQQAADTWNLLKARLEQSGFALGNLVRTWFHNDHILEWYDVFNRARNAFFTEHNIFGTLVPASTGVGACNAAGTALTVDALAIAPKRAPGGGALLDVRAVTSPLQCPAYNYLSAFSRAVEYAPAAAPSSVPAPSPSPLRHMLVSGTASIEPGGATINQGDLDAQIDLSVRVVGAILKSRGMDWGDTARAILYFPKIEWMARWEARRVALGLPPIPAIYAHCDICRADLLFEIEIDACAGAPHGKALS